MDTTFAPALIAAIATILAAFLGYLITYWNNIRLSQRSEQLKRVNKQLSEFYGPMYSLVSTGNQTWAAFRSRHRPAMPSYSEENPPLSDEELKIWRLWICTVFMPRNIQLQELIVTKSDLLIETDMPDCLNNLSAHVAAYQAVLKKWENNDFSEHLSIIGYPAEELLKYSQRSFRTLKERQAKLLGDMSKRE